MENQDDRNGNESLIGVSADFTSLVSRAGRGFVAAQGKNPETEGAALAEYLKSGKPLGRGERELLAELVQGHWRQPAGRAAVNASKPEVIAVVKYLRELESEDWPRHAAKHAVATKFKISMSTVETYERMILDGEKAIKQEKNKRKPPD